MAYGVNLWCPRAYASKSTRQEEAIKTTGRGEASLAFAIRLSTSFLYLLGIQHSVAGEPIAQIWRGFAGKPPNQAGGREWANQLGGDLSEFHDRQQ